MPPPQRVRVGQQDLKLVLPTGGTLVGRVLEGGAPVSYFGLGLLPERRRLDGPITDPIGVRSDDGRFAIRHVPPGKRRVAVLAPGTRLAITEKITIAGNETIDLGDVVLERGTRITGFVRDRSGAPVVNARVIVGALPVASVKSPIENWFLGQYEAFTDATGAYTLEGVDAPRPSFGPFGGTIQAIHPVAGLSVISEVPVTDATLDFVLLGRGRIEGTVSNLRGYLLVAMRAGEPPHARMVFEKKGQFELEVPPGDYVIRRHDEESPSVRVTVADGQTVSATLVMDG